MKYRIYHWDNFEPPGEDTLLIGDAETIQEAEDLIIQKYGNRLFGNGADRIQIVNAQGDVVKSFNVA